MCRSRLAVLLEGHHHRFLFRTSLKVSFALAFSGKLLDFLNAIVILIALTPRLYIVKIITFDSKIFNSWRIKKRFDQSASFYVSGPYIWENEILTIDELVTWVTVRYLYLTASYSFKIDIVKIFLIRKIHTFYNSQNDKIMGRVNPLRALPSQKTNSSRGCFYI